jgi:pimeloyl-ACP methyl ester carboxylesterase
MSWAEESDLLKFQVMPLLERPDGARVWWEEHGAGPGVLICNTFNLAPVEPLVEQLAGERRVLTYEPRGLGRSSHQGPYDLDTGVADLIAILEEADAVEVALGIGDGGHRAVRAAVERPDLIERVVLTSTGLGRTPDAEASAGFAGSTEVLSALMSLLRRDYRTGLRSMVGGSGGFHTGDSERERVEELAASVPQEASIGYLEAWIDAGSGHQARELGSRFTVLAYPGNDWFPLAMYESMRDYLTEACFEYVEDGPISRPDLTAALLRRVTEPARG